MPTIRYTADGGRYRVAGETFEPGDSADVSDGLAEHLVDDVGDFERVHENITDVEFEEVDDDGDGSDGQEGKPPDVDEWEDWNEDDWLELDYQQRADDVRAGLVDDHLDEIEDAETSTTVVDAVALRKQDLED